MVVENCSVELLVEPGVVVMCCWVVCVQRAFARIELRIISGIGCCDIEVAVGFGVVGVRLVVVLVISRTLLGPEM